MESSELNGHVSGLEQMWERGSRDSAWFGLAVLAVHILWNIAHVLSVIAKKK